jgi:hypothetical protein
VFYEYKNLNQKAMTVILSYISSFNMRDDVNNFLMYFPHTFLS